MTNAIFGYGSLISPLSFVGRHVACNNIDAVYEQNKMLSDYHDRTKSLEAWEDLKDSGIKMYLVSLDGYKRYYSIEHRNGGMLEVYPDKHSHNPSEVGTVNGSLFCNVPDDVYASVSNSEGKYEEHKIGLDEFNYLSDEPKDKSGKTNIYVAKSGRNKKVSRHPVYHDGILKSYVFLLREEDYIPNNIVKEHLFNYLQHTYEYQDNEWQTLYEIDGNKDLKRVNRIIENSVEIY